MWIASRACFGKVHKSFFTKNKNHREWSDDCHSFKITGGAKKEGESGAAVSPSLAWTQTQEADVGPLCLPKWFQKYISTFYKL